MFTTTNRYFLVFCCLFSIATLASCTQIPGYTIVGQLIDSDGEPLEAKEITLGRYLNFVDEFHSFSTPYEAGRPYGSTTDDNGMFQIYAERTGSYLLLYESEIDDIGIHTLTDSRGNVVYFELSETVGANVGKVFVDSYPNLPNKYLPDFLNNVSLGMTFEDLETQRSNLVSASTTEDLDYFEVTNAEDVVSKVIYGFDKENHLLEKIEVLFTHENGAFRFGEATFGIPHYQGPSINGKSVIHWYFHYTDQLVSATANGNQLVYQINSNGSN